MDSVNVSDEYEQGQQQSERRPRETNVEINVSTAVNDHGLEPSLINNKRNDDKFIVGDAFAISRTANTAQCISRERTIAVVM